MSKDFSNINTEFDALDVLTSDKPRPKQSSTITIPIKEPKTKRTSVVLKQSVYSKLQKIARKYRCSINEVINQVIEKIEI